MQLQPTALVASTLLFHVSCGPLGDPQDHDFDAAPTAVVSLEIAPARATLEVIDGAAARQAFTVKARMADGSTLDVSESAVLSIDRPQLGRFDGAEFTAGGYAAGEGTVVARYEGESASASLAVHVRITDVVAPAPASAPELFGAAGDDPALAPTLVYPASGTLVPPNLGELDVHWTRPVASDLFEVAVSSDYLQLRAYAVDAPGAGSWITLRRELWGVIARSCRGMSITIQVRGLSSAEPQGETRAGTSSAVTLRLAEQDVQGGIYYWGVAPDGSRGGIYRHDMDRPGQQAEPFQPVGVAPAGRCVGCHALSRDGARMAVTFDGGNGAGTIIDVASRSLALPVDGARAWTFAVFEPVGPGRLLTALHGALALRSPDTGHVVTTVPTRRYATHPSFHPDGTAIAYVEAGSASNDWTFSGGSIVAQPFDPATASFGAPETLVTGGGNNYYPSWSPDGEWLVFNRSSGDSYDDANARLYVVKADGSMPPMRLDLADAGDLLTNSWARWAPFVQTMGDGASAETYYWLTFSSKREFGVRVTGAARKPQIWMAPFFPARAAAGGDPSLPAFRLPAQDIESSNHIAEWTERVVPIE